MSVRAAIAAMTAGVLWWCGGCAVPQGAVPEEEETPVEILPRRISHIKITYPDDLSFVQQFAYDEQGRIASITETDQQYAYQLLRRYLSYQFGLYFHEQLK